MIYKALLITLCAWPMVAHTSKTGVNRPLKFIGDVNQILIPAVAFTTTLCLKDYKGTVQFLEAFAATEATVFTLKFTINEKRPAGKERHSFPSGHTASAFCGAAFINRRYGFKYAIPAYAGAALVAAARIQSKAHWVHDVVAGAAIGMLYSFVFAKPYMPRTEIIPSVTKDSIALHCHHKF